MRGVVLMVVVAVAGCGGAEPSCYVEDEIVERAGAQELADCGTGTATDAMDALQAIHDCVVADVAAETPFRAELDVHGSDDEHAYAYLGITEGGVWHGFHYAYVGTPSTGSRGLSTYACTAITDKQPCDLAELRTSLCLGCENATGVASCISQ